MAFWGYNGIGFDMEIQSGEPPTSLPTYQQEVSTRMYVGGGFSTQVGPIPPKSFRGRAFVNDGSAYSALVASADNVARSLTTDNGSHSNMKLSFPGGRPGKYISPSGAYGADVVFTETTP